MSAGLAPAMGDGPETTSERSELPPAGPRCSVVIPSWNARDALRDCLASVAAQRVDGGLETIVVDNASTDGTDAMLERVEAPHTLLRQASNVGYCEGAKRGARAARGQILFILNSDTVLRGPDVLQLLADALDRPSTGLVGPRYEWPDGTLQPCCANDPSIGSALVVGSRLHRLLSDRALARLYPPQWSHASSREADWVMGAVLGIDADLFAAVGGFWPLLYGSEQDLAWKVRERGLSVRYVREAVVMHDAAYSNRQRYGEPERRARVALAELAFLATRYPRPRAEAIRFVTGTAFAARALLLRAAGRLERSREYAAMARTYARGLRAGRRALREAAS